MKINACIFISYLLTDSVSTFGEMGGRYSNSDERRFKKEKHKTESKTSTAPEKGCFKLRWTRESRRDERNRTRENRRREVRKETRRSENKKQRNSHGKAYQKW
jgi:hypothetical protein